MLGTETTTLDAAGRGDRHLRTCRRVTPREVAAQAERSPGPSCRSRRWCRPSRSTASGCTSWPGRGSRSSGRPGRSPCTASTSVSPSTPRSHPDRVECSSGTYVRTAGRRPRRGAGWWRAPPCPATDRDRLVHPRRAVPSRTLSPELLLTPAAGVRDLPQWWSTATWPRRRATARCSPPERPRCRAATALGGARPDGDAAGGVRGARRPHGEARRRPASAAGSLDLASMEVLRDSTPAAPGRGQRRSRSAPTTACTSGTGR